MVKIVLANTLKVGDVIRIAEGDRKITVIKRDDPAIYPDSVVLTLGFEGSDAPFFVGCDSLQTLVTAEYVI